MLERRYCTAETPMPFEERRLYQWGHGDAIEVRPFFNLMIYVCPNCGHNFAAIPRAEEVAKTPPH